MSEQGKNIKVRWDVVIPCVICLLLSVYLVISLFAGGSKKPTKNYDINTVCGLNGKKTLKTLEKENRENPLSVVDYNFYGESLNLFTEPYSLATYSSNTLKDYVIVFKELCSGQEVVFEIGNRIDEQIDTGLLPVGFYSVYAREGETDHRIYFENKVSQREDFYTVIRDGKVNKIELIADKAYFDAKDQKESNLDNNYLYVNVTALQEIEDVYDVAISTAPALLSFNETEEGEKVKNSTEARELYDMALGIKQQLEEAGLKVIILKDASNEKVLFYGDGSVLERAYVSNAKYMIHLDMTIGNFANTVYYSSHSSGRLAKCVYDQLMATTTLFSEDRCKKSATTSSTLLEDYGKIFDSDYEIREAGGKVTVAGLFSNSSKQNAVFAENVVNGIDTIKITVCNVRQDKSIQLFNENKQAAIDAIAKGILNCLNHVVTSTGE